MHNQIKSVLCIIKVNQFLIINDFWAKKICNVTFGKKRALLCCRTLVSYSILLSMTYDLVLYNISVSPLTFNLMYSCIVEYFCGETDWGLWHAENKHGPGNPRDGQCPHDWQGRQGNQFVYIMFTIVTTSNPISYISRKFRTSMWFCLLFYRN